jgi:hypothetical protein
MRSSRPQKARAQDDRLKGTPPLYPPSMGEFIRWYFQDRIINKEIQRESVMTLKEVNVHLKKRKSAFTRIFN